MAYKSKEKKASGPASVILSISTVVFTCMLLFGLGMAARDILQSKKDQAAFRELAYLVEKQQQLSNETADDTAPEADDQAENTEPEKSPYQVLYELNPDFVAWLTVPGTAIDYPVVHTPDDVESYIYRDFSGADSPSGTPFMGEQGLDSQKCIIYGHNMRDGTMFNSLLKYESQSFWQENPTFTLNTLEGERTYEIFSAVRTNILAQNEPGLRYYRLEDGLEQWLVENALYSTGILPREGDNILILSTCSYHTEEGRFIIAGRMK